MSKANSSLLVLILLIGAAVRFYHFTSPVADWHSFRQVDTLSVTKIFQQEGLNLFYPRYHDLSSLQSGIENPQGYRMVEFPIYNLLSLGLAQIGLLNLDLSSRLVSIILSLTSAYLIFKIALKYASNFRIALFSTSVFLFLPFSFFFSRTTLPENTAVTLMLLSIFYYQDHPLFSSFWLSLSALVKPYTLILIGPFFLFQTPIRFFVRNLLYLTLSTLPLFGWRKWISFFPEGIPKSDWLLNNGNTTTFPVWYRGYNLTFLNKLVAFRPHWWHWLFFERINQLILGGFGIIPLFLGYIYKKDRFQKLIFNLSLGVIAYFIIIAQGNIQHDYYQILILPALSLTVGAGIYFLLNFTFANRIVSVSSTLFLITLSLYFSWEQVKPYYVFDPQIITAGNVAQKLIPSNALLIAPHNGDTTLLYQTGFKGWPIEIYDFDKLIKTHQDHPIYFLTIDRNSYTDKIVSQYPPLYQDNNLIISQISHE